MIDVEFKACLVCFLLSVSRNTKDLAMIEKEMGDGGNEKKMSN